MDNNHKVQISVQLKDQATDPLKRVSRSVKDMSSNLNSAGTSIGAFANRLDTVARRIDRLANSMFRFNMYAGGMINTARNLAATGIFAGGALAYNSANKSIDYEHKMYTMQTRMETSDKARQQLSNYILNDLNPTVAYGPSQLADIGIILGQAGINSTADMKSLLKTTAYFSEAVDADPSQATEMIVSAAKGFDIAMKDSSKITNMLTVALNKSLLHVEELPHAIGELAGRSKMLGQSFESSLTALMAMRDQGMSAAQGAQDFLHGLRQLSMAARTDLLMPKRAEQYQELGVDLSFFDMEKKQIKEFPEIIESLEKTFQNKGWMPNKEEFYKMVQANGGQLPEDIVNKMESMPLISRVFGAAGQAPIIMGLQARFEEVDADGNKTGKVYYGSDALKKMREEVKTTRNVVDEVHSKIAETAKFQLEVLSGTWEAAQIKVTDDFLPLIKTTTEELKKYIGGQDTTGSLDNFNRAIKDTAKNLRDTNPMLADMVEMTGQLAVNSIKIGGTVLPPVMGEIGNATGNLINANWGGSMWTLPYYATTNGFDFISDLFNNEQSDKAISQLPKELQDDASLTRDLIKGGLAVVAAGAIIKVLEITFRAISMGVKGIKGVTELGNVIIKTITGSIQGGAAGGAKTALETLKKNMAINANIVNVYGKVVNDGGDFPDIDGNKNRPSKTPTPSKLPKIPGGTVVGGAPAAVGLGIPLMIGGVIAWEQNKQEETRKRAEQRASVVLQRGDEVDKFRRQQYDNTMAYTTQQYNQMTNAMFLNGDPKRNALENAKVENKINLTMNPQIIISGELKNQLTNLSTKIENNNLVMNAYNQMQSYQAKRYSDRVKGW